MFVLSNNLKKQSVITLTQHLCFPCYFLLQLLRPEKSNPPERAAYFSLFLSIQMGIRYATQLISPLDNPRDISFSGGVSFDLAYLRYIYQIPWQNLWDSAIPR